MSSLLENETILIALIGGAFSIVTGVCGFFFKSIWDSRQNEKARKTELKLTSLLKTNERALKNFYWPIYIRLGGNAVSWKKATEQQDFAYIIEQEIILPVHLEIVGIIEKYIYLCQPDSEFNEQILLYIKYVSLYRGIRASGDLIHFPADYECHFPSKFVTLIEEYTLSTQMEYNRLLGLQFDKSSHRSKEMQRIFKYKIKQADTPVQKSWLQTQLSNIRKRVIPDAAQEPDEEMGVAPITKQSTTFMPAEFEMFPRPKRFERETAFRNSTEELQNDETVAATNQVSVSSNSNSTEMIQRITEQQILQNMARAQYIQQPTPSFRNIYMTNSICVNE